MKLSGWELGLAGLDGLAGFDSLCVFVAEDERPLTGLAGHLDWRLCGGLSRVLVQGLFSGEEGDCVLLPSSGRIPPIRVFAVGMGKGQVSSFRLGELLAGAAERLSRAKVSRVALEVPGAGVVEDEERVRALSTRFIPAFTGVEVGVLGEKALLSRLPLAEAEKSA